MVWTSDRSRKCASISAFTFPGSLRLAASLIQMRLLQYFVSMKYFVSMNCSCSSPYSYGRGRTKYMEQSPWPIKGNSDKSCSFDYRWAEYIQLLKTKIEEDGNQKNWDRNPNHHLYLLASNLFLPLSNNSNNKINLPQIALYTVHEPAGGGSAVQLRQELVQIILIGILRLIPKLIQTIKNGLQAFATRFPLTLLVACLIHGPENGSEKQNISHESKEQTNELPYFSWSRGWCEQIKQLVSVHGLQARVLSIDDSIGDWHLEPLERHHLLLKGATHDETVNIHHFPLTQSMCSVHSLQDRQGYDD